MNLSATERFSVAHAAEIYGLDAWGNGYFSVRGDGHLIVSPFRDSRRGIDVYDTVRELAAKGLNTPLMLRFPQLLEGQVLELTQAFRRAIEEFAYGESFRPVFPMKVNQQRTVIDGLLRAGRDAGLGLEVGSRPELLAAVALPTPSDSLIVCNGFKDADYLSCASFAARLGKQVVVVIEKPFELDSILELIGTGQPLPWLGFRIRLQARGSGLWEKSGGFASKFGLTTRQLLHSVERLKEVGLLDRVVLVHFHIGSQITEIRKIKNAVREGSRIYAKLRKAGVGIRFLDVGGGLGIDYDGSKTSSDASVNYAVQEYANDVVFGISEVCEEEEVPPPTIVSESGRMLVGYHSMLVTDVRDAIIGVDPDPPAAGADEHPVIEALAEVARTITVKNYREFYHDAVEYRDQMYSLFGLGMLDLDQRARGETLFASISSKAVRFSKSAKFVADEFVELESKLQDKYICNFSVFQSLPDHWALDQLFPVMPIHRLNEPPKCRATLADITCDSDGEVEKFVDLKDIKESLEVHDLIPGQPYYLAFALVGAYQDTMGDLHNLFGRVHEADVVVDEVGRTVVQSVRRGEVAADALRSFGFDPGTLTERVSAMLGDRVAEGHIERGEAQAMLDDYRRRLDHYTYLNP